jgi:Cohesin domain
MAMGLRVVQSMPFETVKVYVDPPSLANYLLVPGELFNVSLNVDNIPVDPGLIGVQLRFSYDPALLNVRVFEEVMFHNVTPPSEWDNIWELMHRINNTGGYLDYAYTWLDLWRAVDGGYAPITGNHTMAIITFEVMGRGECALRFDQVLLADLNSERIPCDVSDGYFNNISPPMPALTVYVDPSEVENNSLDIGSVFDISVRMDSNIDHPGVVGLQFNLTWDPTILEAVNMTEIMFHEVTPENESDNIWQIMQKINNTGGYLVYAYAFMDIKTALAHGYAPITGNHTLASITFRIRDTGTSGLNLTACKAGDASGKPLICETADGVFRLSGVIPGDINLDGIVDISDAILASRAYGSSIGDPNWNALVDLDGNGIVDIFDLIRLASVFGRRR